MSSQIDVDPEYSRKQKAATTIVIILFLHSFLALVGGIFALVIYGVPQYSLDNNSVSQCPLYHINNYSLALGVTELLNFCLSLLAPLCFILELKLKEGFHPGLTSQCFASLRLLLGFISAAFLIKGFASFYSNNCVGILSHHCIYLK